MGFIMGGALFSYRHPMPVMRVAILFPSFMIITSYFTIAFLRIYRVL